METKNTVANESNEPKRNNPHVTARIDRLVDYENTKVKAIASVNIGGAFAIHGLRIIDSLNWNLRSRRSMRRLVRARN